MSYSHLTITDRIKIETYLDLVLKPCQIASELVSISLLFQESSDGSKMVIPQS